MRVGAATLVIAGIGFLAATHSPLGFADPPADGRQATVYRDVTVTRARRIEGHGVEWWRYRAVVNRRALNATRAHEKVLARRVRAAGRDARRRWEPSLRNAVTLASAVTGVSASDMLRVAYCESTWNIFAVNGRYKGAWQLGWNPFGLSPFDPYAAALSTAMTVRHDGGWSQWQCKP